jgi:ribosomal protein S18 acetylase RimI-like enzyme
LSRDIPYIPHGDCWVTFKTSTAIAFGQYYKKADRCHLARLVVSPSYRSRGIGYNFIYKLMEIGMQDLSVKECSLFVVRSNEKALKCYQALQFEKADYPPGHEQYGDIDFMVRKSDLPKIIEK